MTLDYLASPPSRHKRSHYQHLSTSAHPCSPLTPSSHSVSQTAQPSLDGKKKKKKIARVCSINGPLFFSPRAAVTSALPFPGSIAFDSCAVESAGGEWAAVRHSISGWQEMAALSSGTGCLSHHPADICLGGCSEALTARCPVIILS